METPPPIVAVGLAAMLWSAGAAAQEERPLLSGPEVRTSSQKQAAGDHATDMAERMAPMTIVARDFEGNLIELEMHPAAAALEKLALTEGERAATERILSDRFATASRIAAEHQALLLRVQTARRGGEERELRTLMAEVRPVVEPMMRPTLAEQLAKALSKESADALKHMVDEYMDAAAAPAEGTPEPSMPEAADRGEAAETGAARSKGPRAGRGGDRMAAQRAEMGQVLREIARAFAATVDSRREQTDAMYRAINATPEQQTEIQTILRDVGSELGLGTPSPERRREVMRRISAILTPEQRELARKHFGPFE